MGYRAIRTCWHGKRLYKPGMEFVPADDGEAPPRHFVPEKKFSAKAVDEAAREEKLKKVAIKAQKAAEDGGAPAETAKKT